MCSLEGECMVHLIWLYSKSTFGQCLGVACFTQQCLGVCKATVCLKNNCTDSDRVQQRLGKSKMPVEIPRWLLTTVLLIGSNTFMTFAWCVLLCA